MDDDQWIILDEPKATPTPNSSVINTQLPTVRHQDEILNVTSTSILLDAVTSKPSVEVTIGSPILPVHDNDTSTRLPHGGFNGFEGGEKAHQFGNATGMIFN